MEKNCSAEQIKHKLAWIFVACNMYQPLVHKLFVICFNRW